MECAETLYLWEAEQEANRMALLAGVAVTNQFGLENAVPEITQANFRDQGW